jgi:sec-independent protein translocase protein TatA
MAFGDPLQWIIIGVIVIAIFLWGPQKIPELARGIGRARKEFDMASKEFNNPTSTLLGTTNTTTAPVKTSDDILLDTARQLGISTVGKTREEISQEIVSKSKVK